MSNNTNNNSKDNTNNSVGFSEIPKKLFQSESTIEKPKSNKKDRFISDRIKLLAEFNFSARVQEVIIEFITMLADIGAMLPEISLRFQLQKLSDIGEADQFRVVRTTMTRGWRSLDYAIDGLNKDKKTSFDTAIGCVNQFKKSNDENRWKPEYDLNGVF